MSTSYREASVDFDYDAVDQPDFSKLDDKVFEELPEVLQEYVQQRIRAEVRDAMTQLLSMIYDSSNYRLRIATIVCSFGLPLFLGKSMKDIAGLHGVTKQALSKSVKLFQKQFDLSPTRGQKSLKACEKYKQIQLQRHDRHRNKTN
jgi:hypothetical protein